jgi:hypothetical protein
MKVRKLQRLNNAQQWEDHGYAFEHENGQCLFRFNTLVWGRIGAEYNATMKKKWHDLRRGAYGGSHWRPAALVGH